MKPNLVLSILQEKCPHCSIGGVYETKKYFLQLPVMKKQCDKCEYHFDREPGYFIGAMYISYGLAILEALITFFVFFFIFPSISAFGLALSLVLVIVIFSLKNYKLSRIIYMHLFPW